MPARATRPSRPAGRDDEAVSRFIERFALVLTAAGMQRMAARVFGALLASESGTLTAAQLAAVLQVSPASVSGAVRYLEQTGLARRERVPGQRTDHFVLRTDVWYEDSARPAGIYQALSVALADGVSAVGSSSAAGVRLGETREFFEYLKVQMPMLVERWRASRS